MHVKKWKVEEFFDTKGKLLFTKKIKESEGKEKWVQEEGDQENKRSNKKVKEVNTKRDEQKQEVMKKGRKKKLVRKKNTKNERDSVF